MNIITTLGEQLDADLAGISSYKIERSRTKFGVPSKDISAKIEATYGLSDALKESLKSIYTQVKEISFYWSLNDAANDDLLAKDTWLNGGYGDYLKDQDLSGSMNLVSFDEMMQDKSYFSYLKGNGVEYLPLDKHWALGAGLKKDKGKVEDNVYLFNAEGAALMDMKIGVLEYIKLAAQARGFYYWQYAYLSKEGIYNKHLKEMLPKIFHNSALDLSNF
ncbi:hypothetical protein [Aureispira anguillae]|uniref:Uncharacterized protein n=1 Tax=Aureispira anguillae TaxID=2864201 RepID=A0A915YGK4_9BACT|nr:hypothetical protein [Aureispira anguillae]BDS12634.1 hypothetical protein AsAng_0033580 [Aureispira anguillae]